MLLEYPELFGNSRTFNQPKDSRFQGKIPDFVRDSEGFQMTCTGFQPVTDPSVDLDSDDGVIPG